MPALAQAPAAPEFGAEAVERLTSATAPCPGLTDPPPRAPAPFGGPAHDRPKLTGDWSGVRSELRDCGITVDVSVTQFYQGVTTGGLERAFAYGERNDYFLTLDGEKLGLWEGFSVKLHGETRYGESVNFITGSLSPVNEYLLVPGSDGVVSGLTGVEFSQFIGENTLVLAGKINLLDHILQPLTGATGLEGFQNVSLIFNPILARTLPYSTFGVGGTYLKDGHPVLAVSVFDAIDRSTTGAFDNGAVVFATAVLPTTVFGLPGHSGVEGAYSSGRYTNIDRSPYLDPVTGLVAPSPPKTGSWAVGYLFDQAVWASPDDPKRVWGVFGSLVLRTTTRTRSAGPPLGASAGRARSRGGRGTRSGSGTSTWGSATP